MPDVAIRRCYQQQVRAIAWRRAQVALAAEFDRQKQALTASLSEHLEAGRDGDEWFRELAEDMDGGMAGGAFATGGADKQEGRGFPSSAREAG